MSSLNCQLLRKDNNDHPVVVSVGRESAWITVDWARTRSNDVRLIVQAREEVDILTPHTFKVLKKRIKELESEILQLKGKLYASSETPGTFTSNDIQLANSVRADIPGDPARETRSGNH